MVGSIHQSRYIDTSMKNPKQNDMGIWSRKFRRSSFNCCRVMRNRSRITKNRLSRIVHTPMVYGVNMLRTYVTLVIGEVPRAALVMNAMPNALTNRAIRNKK